MLDREVVTLGCSKQKISGCCTDIYRNIHIHNHNYIRLLAGWCYMRGRQMGKDMTGVYRDSCGRLPSSRLHTCYTSCPLQ